MSRESPACVSSESQRGTHDHGVRIAVVATIQLAVAALIMFRRDPWLFWFYCLGPLYPLAFWLINALAAMFAEAGGIVRGPRKKRVTWDIRRSGGGDPAPR